jgi:hypothetical protein
MCVRQGYAVTRYPPGKALCSPRLIPPVTWADLFARAGRYDRTEADVIETFRRHRADDDDAD